MVMTGGLVEAGKAQGSAYLGLSGGTIGRLECATSGVELGGIEVSGGVVGGDFVSFSGVAELKGTGVVTGTLKCQGNMP